mgnify:CR=1 FL=1
MPFSCISVKADRIRAISSSSEGIRWLSRVMVSTVSTIWAVSSGKLHWMLPSRTPLADDVGQDGFQFGDDVWRGELLVYEGAFLLFVEGVYFLPASQFHGGVQAGVYMISSFLKASRWEDAASSLPSSRTRE